MIKTSADAGHMSLKGSRFGKTHVTLQPGDYIVSCEDIAVSTVLGSCVSVCFYSDRSPYFGMNHFMLPVSRRKSDGDKDIMHTESAFFGMNAMEIVINALMRAGIPKNHLRTKVFGGGNVLPMQLAGKTVGEQNIEFTLKFLEQERIPVVSCSAGGDYARKIIYFQQTHEVLLQKLNRSEDRFIIEEEEALLNVPRNKPDIEIFQ